jgi:uncharacterized protein involved in exopolysaccharide biosynthesis
VETEGRVSVMAQEVFSLRDFLSSIFRRINILKFIVILLPLGTLVACFLVSPVYQSSAKVIVTAKKENTGLLLAPKESMQRGNLNLNVDETDLNSEMEILLSMDLWIRTVRKLGIDYFKSKKQSGVKAGVKRLIKRTGLTVGAGSNRSSQGALTGVAKESADVQKMAEDLISRFKIVPGQKSRVLDLSFKDSDPDKAQKILATLLNLYIPYQLEVYAIPGAQGFYSGQGDKYRERFEQANTRLVEFKKKWGIAGADKQKDEFLSVIRNLEDSLISIHSNLGQYEYMLDSLKRDIIPTGQLARSIQGTGENPYITTLATQLLRAQQERQQIQKRFSQNSRDVRAAEDAVEALKNRFRDALQTEVEVLKTKNATLETSLKEKRAQLSQIEEKSEEVRTLELATEIEKERYLKYVRKAEEAQQGNLMKGINLVNVSILSQPSRPTHPIFPKKKLFTLAALLMAFPLGIGIILVAGYFDHTFDNPQEVERGTGHPVLASLKKL